MWGSISGNYLQDLEMQQVAFEWIKTRSSVGYQDVYAQGCGSRMGTCKDREDKADYVAKSQIQH